MNIIIINGPNLNLLGKREPEIYGNTTFEEYFENLKSNNSEIELEYFQSNHEGEIIDKLHSIADTHNGIVINPAAFSHYSIAILDALKAVNIPAFEVHISNIENREDFRKNKITAQGCVGCISGLGLDGYKLAIENLIEYINEH